MLIRQLSRLPAALRASLKKATNMSKSVMVWHTILVPLMLERHDTDGSLQSVVTFPTPKAAQFKRKIWSVLGMGQPLNVRKTCSAASCVANSTNPYPSDTAVFLFLMILTLTRLAVPASRSDPESQKRSFWQDVHQGDYKEVEGVRAGFARGAHHTTLNT